MIFLDKNIRNSYKYPQLKKHDTMGMISHNILASLLTPPTKEFLTRPDLGS